MRKARTTIEPIGFQNLRLTRVGIDVLTLAELRKRAPQTLIAPQRVGFHLLLLIEHGRSKHFVDFEEHELSAGSALFVRPGQVQQWALHDSLQGQLLLIAAEALGPSIARAATDVALLRLEEWPAHLRPAATLFHVAKEAVRRLREDLDQFDGSEIQSAFIQHSLLALLLRWSQAACPERLDVTHREVDLYRLFTKELESHFHERLSVQDCAKRLGYSQSSISRACLTVSGHTAKDAIDERVALEAKRLLIHSKSTVARISQQLGFAEATNFVKFFRRMTGVPPLEYREQVVVKR